MNVGELVDLLSKVDRARLVYVPDSDGKCELAAGVVDLRHLEIPIPGIAIPDDVVILPAAMLEEATE